MIFLKDFFEHKKVIILLSGIMIIGSLLLAFNLQGTYSGFAQDDAWISFRYARNLVAGNGLTFNPNEYVEGFSNFLWVILSAVVIYFGGDPLLWMKSLGSFSGLLLIIVTALITYYINPSKEGWLWSLVPPVLLSASTTLAVWSVSGLEQSFFALCGWAGFLFVLIEVPSGAAVFFCLAVITRPEGILFPLFGLLYLMLKQRDYSKLVGSHPDGVDFSQKVGFLSLFSNAIIGTILFTLFYHLGRYFYFGSFLPNTYYVKGGGGFQNAVIGWSYIKSLCSFNFNYLFLILAPCSLISRKGRAANLTLLTFLIFYLIYQIKVGGDILPLFRLHLTILPASIILAVSGVRSLTELLRVVVKDEYHQGLRFFTVGVVFLVFLFPFVSMVETTRSHVEYSTVIECLNKAHGAAGRYISNLSREGDVVVGQDMGCMPWNGEKLTFLDSIGLTDKVIGRAHYDISYTPYIRYLIWSDEKARARIKTMEDRLREYIFSRNPRFFVINIDIEAEDYGEAFDAISRQDKSYFADKVEANVFFYNLPKSREWNDFKLVHGWAYSEVHLLLLYEKDPFYY